MNAREYIDGVADKIQDEELRERLREELNDHWTDYCEQHSMPTDPKKVLGDAALTVRQANASAAPADLGKDIVRSGICAMAMFILSGLFLSLFQFEFASESFLKILSRVVGLGIWGFATWCLFLSLHRRIVTHYGSSSTKRMILLAMAVPIPCILFWLESITVPLVLTPPDPIQLLSPTLVIIVLLKLFTSAGKMIHDRFNDAEQLLIKIRRNGPIAVSLFVSLGTSLLVTNQDMAVLAIPFTLPLLVLYLLWGMASISFGWVASQMGLPVMVGFYLVILVALLFGVLLPTLSLLKHRRVPSTLRFIAAAIVPLVILLPGIPHDVPKIEWSAPVVWNWDQLEKKQLNIAYPWAAPLMRRNDGMNLSYEAQTIPGGMQVTQAQSYVTVITRQNITGSSLSHEEKRTFKEDPVHVVTQEIPEGFTCDGTPIETYFDTHEGTTGPLGMFGIQCPILSYQGKEIAKIDLGNLMDLDLSDDGLLAVSINMGSYDPTYVYVVDISAI